MNYVLEEQMKDTVRTRCSCLRGLRKVTKFLSEDRMSVRLDCSSVFFKDLTGKTVMPTLK
jgi:hypothetical protein